MVMAARSFCAKLERAHGWDGMARARQLDAASKARAFISWLMVTGQLTVDADLLCRVVFRLGNAARNFCPDAHTWFVSAADQLGTSHDDTVTQWNVLTSTRAPLTGICPPPLNSWPWPLNGTSSGSPGHEPAGATLEADFGSKLQCHWAQKTVRSRWAQ